MRYRFTGLIFGGAYFRNFTAGSKFVPSRHLTNVCGASLTFDLPLTLVCKFTNFKALYPTMLKDIRLLVLIKS